MSAFSDYPTAEQWREANPLPSDRLIYGASRASQLLEMVGIAETLGVEVRFPAKHTSKSVPLPVAAYLLADAVIAYVRDNLHCVNIAVHVLSERELHIPTAALYTETTHHWYENEKVRAEGYSPGRYDFTTTAWHNNWAGGALIEDGGRLFRADTTYLEGIRDVLPNLRMVSLYSPAAREWAVCADSLLPGARGPEHMAASEMLRAIRDCARAPTNPA